MYRALELLLPPPRPTAAAARRRQRRRVGRTGRPCPRAARAARSGVQYARTGGAPECRGSALELTAPPRPDRLRIQGLQRYIGKGRSSVTLTPRGSLCFSLFLTTVRGLDDD